MPLNKKEIHWNCIIGSTDFAMYMRGLVKGGILKRGLDISRGGSVINRATLFCKFTFGYRNNKI